MAQQPERAAVDYDAIIIGSGYGGAIAAAALAGCTDNGRPVSVCVLERGKEYLPGMFPARFADLPGHVRFSTSNSAKPEGTREGLFDVRLGPDVSALVANGLGGGSLINAGVMEEPDDAVFHAHWPEDLKTKASRERLYAHTKLLLGAADREMVNCIGRHRGGLPKKYSMLQRLAEGRPFRPAALSVAMSQKVNAAGVILNECKLCGDCATGCNHGAKDSLDVNLLVRAWRQGAEIYTGATVLRIERDDHRDVWLAVVVHTDERLRNRECEPLKLSARKLILAAGTFGSTEILLRSRSDTLQFSSRLGQGFSTNGDMIAVAYDHAQEVNAVADESTSPDQRSVGPTITGIVDLRGNARSRYVIEDLAIPGPLRRVFEEIVTTSNTLHQLEVPDTAEQGSGTYDPCAVNRAAIRRSSVLAVMARDGSAGSIELIGGENDDHGDGAVRVRWPRLRNRRLFRDQIAKLEQLLRHSDKKARILPNALWQLLPRGMQFLLGNKRGPLFTVHPLGGCPMGRDASDGVVDDCGRVFDAASDDKTVFPGLAVLDGSIMPTSLGINPALTIAALALCSIEKLRTQWRFNPPSHEKLPELQRPVFQVGTTPKPTKPTAIELLERVSGKAVLRGHTGASLSCVIELTLRFEKLPLTNLLFPADESSRLRTLAVREGELRIFREEDWIEWRKNGEPAEWGQPRLREHDIAKMRARVTGHVSLLTAEKLTSRTQIRRAFWAWFWNRGLRDSWQWMIEQWRTRGRKKAFGTVRDERDPGLRQMWRQTWTLAARAAQARVIDYRLTIDEPIWFAKQDGGLAAIFEERSDRRIRGIKRVVYSRRSNPWRQLAELQLLAFPGVEKEQSFWWRRLRRPSRHRSPVLTLDTKYLARQGVPLLRIVEQNDQPAALADLMSLLAYVFRVLLTIHTWSFRRPDTPTPREPQRLPGAVNGLPRPIIRELDVGKLADGTPVRVRLTRYCPNRVKGPPVVMIHGYSASGTTFAHRAVKPNLAQYFCRKRRDVWILDLRTSSGMPTARHPWALEDAALVDLPAAFDYIHHNTGQKLDVVAHCIGAAMFSMAVLAPPSAGDRFFREREAFPNWIRKAVLSQLGPVVVMSPGNVFRAYAMKYLRPYLPLEGYDFRVKQDPALVDRLIDRLLATLPYPEREFDVENPPWPPWRRTPFVGTRHRMDALYGRDFNLVSPDGEVLLRKKVLDHIDDLFGPLSIETLSQTIDIARMQVIASRIGRNEYLSLARLKERWIFPTLSIHGEENGLADPATLAHVRNILGKQAGCEIRVHLLPGFGHQDSLIGKRAGEVFEVISDFLQ